MTNHWIGRSEALERLGVKPQTLYAYVSRRRITARSDPSHPRKSLYALADIERLLSGVAHNDIKPDNDILDFVQKTKGEALIDTEISSNQNQRPYYRTKDALSLSEQDNFETVAALLWNDPLPYPFGSIKTRPDVNFPGSPRARMFGMLSRRCEEDLNPEPVSRKSLTEEAASVLNELIDAVTNGGPRLFFHQRLARAWKVNDPRDIDLIRRILVLSADNGLDEAALAARVTAVSKGPLAASVMSGLASLSGQTLGGRISKAEVFVTQVRRQGNARSVVDSLSQNGLDLPGFEATQTHNDTLRATSLMDAAVHIGEDLKAARQVCEEIAARPLGFSLAMALIGRHLDLPKEAPFTLYALGRTAGWLAHAIEQTQSNAKINARLRYVGVHQLNP
jgi:citrate synthase